MVVALVAPVLVLAARITNQVPQINQDLRQSCRNTLPLVDLRKTIDHAEVIIEGLERGRASAWRLVMEFIFGYAGAPDGYAPEEATFWWVAIAMGVVVLIVVVLLLSSLLSMV